MSEFTYPESFKGRFFGLFILAILQFLNGTVHTIIRIFLIFTASGELVYNIYTFLYGILNLIFGHCLWSDKKSGYLGTISVSLFIIVVDISTVFGVSLIAGVPKAEALGEIMYSLFVISYLFQPKVIKQFMKTN